jgi:hypothetical protein
MTNDNDMDNADPINTTRKSNDQLRSDINILKQRKRKIDETRKFVPLTGIIISLIMLIVYFFSGKSVSALVIGIFYFCVSIIYPLLRISDPITNEIDSLESELSLNLTGVEAKEERAERLFKAHDVGLRRYYDQALSQTKVIFIIGIFCILVGFGFIAASFYIIYEKDSSTNINEKILIGVLGTASGVLTNFVAVIYMKIYSETTKSFTSFHYKLVSSNHLHFVNFLISKIEDKNVLNDTLRDISSKITEKI